MVIINNDYSPTIKSKFLKGNIIRCRSAEPYSWCRICPKVDIDGYCAWPVSIPTTDWWAASDQFDEEFYGYPK